MSFEEILEIINQYLPTITSIAGIIFVIWNNYKSQYKDKYTYNTKYS